MISLGNAILRLQKSNCLGHLCTTDIVLVLEGGKEDIKRCYFANTFGNIEIIMSYI